MCGILFRFGGVNLSTGCQVSVIPSVDKVGCLEAWRNGVEILVFPWRVLVPSLRLRMASMGRQDAPVLHDAGERGMLLCTTYFNGIHVFRKKPIEFLEMP